MPTFEARNEICRAEEMGTLSTCKPVMATTPLDVKANRSRVSMRSCRAQNISISSRLLARQKGSLPCRASSACAPTAACRSAFRPSYGVHSSTRKSQTLFERASIAMKAQYGGDGYRPEGTKEYESLDGIKASCGLKPLLPNLRVYSL